jgi:hypothetical protein
MPFEDDDYSRLQIFGGGIFKHTAWHALACLITDLLDDIEQNSFISSVQSSRTHLLDAVQRQIDILRRQKRAGDLDTEACMLFSCAAAQVSAQVEGNSLPVMIVETAKSSLEFCCSVLEAEVDAKDSTEMI